MYMKQYSVDPIPAVNLDVCMYVTTSQIYRYQDLTHSFEVHRTGMGLIMVGTGSNYIQEN